MAARAMRQLCLVVAAVVALALSGGTPQSPQVSTGARRIFGAITAVTVADGLDHPWSLAFLPDGGMLVTERVGRLRIIRNGILDPNPIAGIPEVYTAGIAGLMDVVLHPRFADNQFVYLSYNKAGPKLPPGVEPMGWRLLVPYQPGGRKPEGSRITTTAALARGRWNGQALIDVHEIFVADDWKDPTISPTNAARLVFGRDGMLYMADGAPNAPAYNGPYTRTQGGRAQDPTSHGGKILRLRDDGGVPPDNPFVNRSGYKPEIYTMGHRNTLGLTVHPETGAIWEHENGPQDGDEVNVLKPGANYGWPVVGMGRDYSGDYIGGPGSIGEPVGRPDAASMYVPGMEPPFIFWTPAVAPSGMAFYTGDRFPLWKGSLFIGVLKYRRLERHVFNAKGWPIRREYYLEDLKQRIRDVRQGPDGLLYILTDENPGAVLRLEPTP